MRYLNSLFTFSPENGDGGDTPPPAGDGSSGGQGDPNKGYAKLLRRHGDDAGAVAALLYQENYQHRERIRQLTAENAELKGKVPAADAVVLTAEQAKSWQAYQSLGKPEEVTAQLERTKKLERDQLVGKAAEAAKFKPAVLGTLLGDMPVEVKEVEADGKKVAVAYVTPAGGAATPLTDYAKANWADFLPALEAASSSNGGGLGAATGTKPFVKQSVSGGNTQSKVQGWKEQNQKAQAERTNPLRAPTPPAK